MNDTEYEAQKARTLALFQQWTKLLGLRWWKTTYVWERERKRAEPKGTSYAREDWDCAFLCSADWRYMEAKITAYLPIIATLDDSELESLVIHECCHVLVNETRVDGNDFIDHEERVCTTLANAFLWVREWQSAPPDKPIVEAPS